MSDYYRTIIEQRTERRRQMTPEQRQVDALEDIADSLVAIEIAIERLADNTGQSAGVPFCGLASEDVLFMFSREENYCHPHDLQRALRAWMTVAPHRLWRELEKQDRKEMQKPGSRMAAETVFSARHALAGYVTANSFGLVGRWLTRRRSETARTSFRHPPKSYPVIVNASRNVTRHTPRAASSVKLPSGLRSPDSASIPNFI
jgi:hypothetical protein